MRHTIDAQAPAHTGEAVDEHVDISPMLGPGRRFHACHSTAVELSDGGAVRPAVDQIVCRPGSSLSASFEQQANVVYERRKLHLFRWGRILGDFPKRGVGEACRTRTTREAALATTFLID